MGTRRHTAKRRLEAGQASLERIGAALLAGVIILALTFTISASSVTPQIERAWCLITSLGEGSCDAVVANPKVPTEPCVVDESGYQASFKEAFLVALKGNRALIVERLSDGTYKVTMVDGGSIGVDVGIGWEARLEVNGTKWGDDMYAGGGVYLDGSVSNVWNVKSDAELGNLVNWARFSDINDTVSGPAAPIIKWIATHTGMVTPPRPPDSTIYAGGISAEGQAGITPWVGGAELAGKLSGNLGYEAHSDGSKTYYVGGGGTLKLTGAISILHGQLGGDASTRMIVDTDKDGNATAVRFETNVAGDSTRSVYTDTVQLNTAADREAFSRFLGEAAGGTGIGLSYPGTEAFLAMMNERGQQTRLSYATDGTDIKAVASGKWVGEVGLEGAFSMPHALLNGAEYFNGTDWVPWTGCLGNN